MPTLEAQLLASFEKIPKAALARLRLCVSAGEALPEDVARRWVDRCGVDIIDGLGTTEMLQTFLSNLPGEIRFGTSGKPVPGYTLRLVDRTGAEVSSGDVGALEVKGMSAAVGYWNQPTKTQETFVGEWVRTGDQYVEDDEGFYHYRGRRDDMLAIAQAALHGSLMTIKDPHRIDDQTICDDVGDGSSPQASGSGLEWTAMSHALEEIRST